MHPCVTTKNPDLPATRELAWIGDAVLSLYARQWILKNLGKLDGDVLRSFTSNHFLSALGQPTLVEAMIGEIFQERGLTDALDWIEEFLLPLFLKQNKRLRSLVTH
ncbi:MAG: hypothetical protein ACK5NG_09400 [Chthoniobacterales bacterium]